MNLKTNAMSELKCWSQSLIFSENWDKNFMQSSMNNWFDMMRSNKYVWPNDWTFSENWSTDI